MDTHTLTLPGFELPKENVGVDAATPDVDHVTLRESLPTELRFGTSSWSFPGWSGIVWSGKYPQQRLARAGLAAYAQHPLLRTVGLDRTYYQTLTASEYGEYHDAVNSDFRFVVKAHEHLTTARFPRHARYGAQAGQVNTLFLDVAYARDRVVAPLVEGLRDRAGVLVFQFPPQSTAVLGSPAQFAERLFHFFAALPKGVKYAAEIRNPDWLTADYVSALRDAGALHCVSVHPRMPSIDEQVRIAASAMESALVCRWNLGHGMEYEAAKTRYEPFDRLVAPDSSTREALATQCINKANEDVPIYIVVNNKAEGSAPHSIFALAKHICATREQSMAI